MANMTLNELNSHIDNVLINYKGDIVELSDAIGAARLGYHYGWRVLRLVINSRTYARHQRILEVDFKDILPEETEYSEKSVAYQIVKKVGRFWDTVNGLVKIDKKDKTRLA